MPKEKRKLTQEELEEIKRRKQATEEKRLAKREEDLALGQNLKKGRQFFNANRPLFSENMDDLSFFNLGFAAVVLYGNTFGVALALRGKKDSYSLRFLQSLLGYRLYTRGKRYHDNKTDGWYFELEVPKSIDFDKHYDCIKAQSLTYIKSAIIMLAFQGKLPEPVCKYILEESKKA